MQHVLTAEVTHLTAFCGQSAGEIQLPQKHKSIYRHSSSTTCSPRMTQNDEQDLNRSTKRYKQQSFIIFHYFHKWALVASFQTALAPRLHLSATDYFPQTWVSWTEKFWRQIWNNSDKHTDSHTHTHKIQKPGRFICNNTFSMPLCSWIPIRLIV